MLLAIVLVLSIFFLAGGVFFAALGGIGWLCFPCHSSGGLLLGRAVRFVRNFFLFSVCARGLRKLWLVFGDRCSRALWFLFTWAICGMHESASAFPGVGVHLFVIRG